MTMKRFVQVALIVGAAFFMMAASASANTITFTTNVAGTWFVSSGTDVLAATSGSLATLTYNPITGSATVPPPSNVSFGSFTIACPTCGSTWSANFGAFTFDLMVDDQTDNAEAQYVGTASAGSVGVTGGTTGSSSITITWVTPASLQIGPGTNNAQPGSNFGNTFFTTISPSIGIVDPTTNGGVTSIQGTVQTFTSSVPEPATLSLIGGALLGLGAFGRKKFFRP
jgi:hypothetical protein